METKLFSVPRVEGFAEEIAEAAQLLRAGALVAIPTETVYGLGADALNAEAVARIYEAKGRPSNNPLIIHVPDASWLADYCDDVPENAYRLADAFWPGPLTMVLRAKSILPRRTTGGLDTVAVRCPAHPVALAIIAAAGTPIAAPSANSSGRPSCTTATHVLQDMNGKIEGIVDGGACAVGVESTILDLTCTPPQLLRPGGLPLERLQAVVGTISIDHAVNGEPSPDQPPRAPGMAYRHYAPKAPVTVVAGAPEKSARYIQIHAPEGAGVICFDEYQRIFPGREVRPLGRSDDKAEQARRVFDALRAFDSTSVREIYAQCPDPEGLGLAIGNRLKKAAGFHVIDAEVDPT